MVRSRQDLLDVVRDRLRKAGIGPGDRLVVGLSGGIDSQTLTHLLARLRQRGAGPELRLVHIDHRLRPSSTSDARTVAQIAREWSLPLDVIAVDVGAWHAALGQGVEADARAARYAALTQVACKWGTDLVAVGHNRDDQVETVLLRLARGASSDGLAGMRAISSRVVSLEPNDLRHATIKIVRPLLDVTRREIEAYAAEHDIVPVVDESNSDTRFRRNAMRHTLIPEFERIVPGASASIARNAGLLADDVDLLNALAAAAFETCCRRVDTTIVLDRAAVREQPVALQRRIVLLSVRAVMNGIELTRERVEALRAATLDGAIGSLIEIGSGVSALVDYAAIFVGPAEQLEREQCRSYALPQIAPDTAITIDRSMTVPANADWAIEIDLLCQTSGWELRTRAAGDRLCLPDGRHKRLQDWLVDHKVPARLRARLPLLVYEGDVRWVAGASPSSFKDVHSRLTARLVTQSGEQPHDGERAPDN